MRCFLCMMSAGWENLLRLKIFSSKNFGLGAASWKFFAKNFTFRRSILHASQAVGLLCPHNKKSPKGLFLLCGQGESNSHQEFGKLLFYH